MPMSSSSSTPLSVCRQGHTNDMQDVHAYYHTLFTHLVAPSRHLAGCEALLRLGAQYCIAFHGNGPDPRAAASPWPTAGQGGAVYMNMCVR